MITALLLAACSASGDPADSAWTDTGGPHAIQNVFVIMMENHNWSSIQGSPRAPYLNDTLLPMASYALDYRGPGVHPSEPNYIWLEAGDNLGIHTDGSPASQHLDTTRHLVTQLEGVGVSWTSYQEGIAGDVCPLLPTGHYAPKHNPMVYFDDVTDGNRPDSARCIAHERPLTELEQDLADGSVARYAFIVPDLCEDMHDSCAPTNDRIRQGDDFLATWVPRILASTPYQEGGLLLITWDESEFASDCALANCPIGMIAVSPFGKGGGYTNTLPYTHSSTLRTVSEIFGVPPLRDARHALDLSDLLDTFP